jgi:hypothetical protein
MIQAGSEARCPGSEPAALNGGLSRARCCFVTGPLMRVALCYSAAGEILDGSVRQT